MKNKLRRIDSVWAFLSADEVGNEVAMGCEVDGIGWVPLIAADEERLASLRRIAKQLAREEQLKVRLVKFTTREDLETIDGLDA